MKLGIALETATNAGQGDQFYQGPERKLHVSIWWEPKLVSQISKQLKNEFKVFKCWSQYEKSLQLKKLLSSFQFVQMYSGKS